MHVLYVRVLWQTPLHSEQAKDTSIHVLQVFFFFFFLHQCVVWRVCSKLLRKNTFFRKVKIVFKEVFAFARCVWCFARCVCGFVYRVLRNGAIVSKTKHFWKKRNILSYYGLASHNFDILCHNYDLLKHVFFLFFFTWCGGNGLSYINNLLDCMLVSY